MEKESADDSLAWMDDLLFSFDPVCVQDLPTQGKWFTWRGPLSEPSAKDGTWRSLAHIQSLAAWKDIMAPRVHEFAAVLDRHGIRADILECQVCKHPGRSVVECLGPDAISGGKQHLSRLWSVALSVGPGLWQEAQVPGGMVRYNYVDGTVQLCRGDAPRVPSPLAAAASAPAPEPAPARRTKASGRNKRGSRSSAHTRSSRSSGRPSPPRNSTAASSSSSRLASVVPVPLPPPMPSAPPPPSSPPPENIPDCRSLAAPPLLAPIPDIDGADSDNEERVVLDTKPLGLEIGPMEDGKGAIVSKSEGTAAAAGVEAGSVILAINEHPVEDMPTNEIKDMMDAEQAPITLDFRPPLNLQKAPGRKRRRDPVTVCTAHCRGSHRVVSESIQHLGWAEHPQEGRSASVHWVEHSDPTDGIAPVQTISRIEAFLVLCRKARLAQSLNVWLTECPEDFAFSPQTWILPYDLAQLKAAMAKGDETFIAKPTGGAQGKGIVLARRWKELERIAERSKIQVGPTGKEQSRNEFVVQRYFSQPLLLDGLKFDMRLYVVVTSVVPLRAYLFKEGLARFCTVPYQEPTNGNLKDSRMHLTNFALNKSSKDFQVSEGLEKHDEGSKRSVSAVLRQVEAVYGVGAEEMWGKVAKLAANTLMALRPSIVDFFVNESPRPLHPLGPKGFQIIGLDVLLDGEVEPRLLELNANPSLSATQPAGLQGLVPNPSDPDLEGLDVLGADDDPGAAAASAAPSAAAAAAPVLLNSTLLQPGLPGSSLAQPSIAPVAGATAAAAGTPPLAPVSANVVSLGASPSPAQMRRSASVRGGSLGSTARAAAMAALSGGPRFSSQTPPPMRSSSSLGPAPAAAAGSGMTVSASQPRLQSATARQSGVASPAPAGARGSSARGSISRRSGSSAAQGARRGRDGGSRRTRTGLPERRESTKAERNVVTSELDLEIKRELVTQALLLVKPAPQIKTARLRKQWNSTTRPIGDYVPLDDEGAWALSTRRARAEGTRPDAPDRCPAFEVLDFGALTADPVMEYAKAHLALYRFWCKSCGQGKESLGQAQMMRLVERAGLVGTGKMWPDKVSANLWFSRFWREFTAGAYGLNLPQFVALIGRIGRMMCAGIGPEAEGSEDAERVTHVAGVLEFVGRGLA